MGLFDAILGNAGAVTPESLQREYSQLLLQGEAVEAGFKLVRDVFIFTNARLILVDVQGITGSKVEYLSLPYKSISRFSIETAGTFDLDAELKIWVSSEATPSVKKKFNRSVNIYDLQKFLAFHVLSGGGAAQGFEMPVAQPAPPDEPKGGDSPSRSDFMPMR